MKKIVITTITLGLLIPFFQCSTSVDAQAIFKAKCVKCHGEDGKKGFNGAYDLTKSDYDLQKRIETINIGPGRMPKFKGKLSPEEIEALAQYTIDTFGSKEVE